MRQQFQRVSFASVNRPTMPDIRSIMRQINHSESTNHLRVAVFVLAVTMSASASAHGDQKHARKDNKSISKEEKEFGREADPQKVNRTIRVDMSDTMRFTPAPRAASNRL